MTLPTSPGRSPTDFRLSDSRRPKRIATWFAGITNATAATAFSGATAATQSDLVPSVAMTSTSGSPVLMLPIFGICVGNRPFPSLKLSHNQTDPMPKYKSGPTAPSTSCVNWPVLACFDPRWPNLTFGSALAMFKLVAIEDVQHAGEGRVVRLHDIPNGPRSVCKNRHDETRIFVT